MKKTETKKATAKAPKEKKAKAVKASAVAGEAMDVKIYDQSGKSSGSLSVPANIFNLPWNADLVHQVVNSMRSSSRLPVAHTKTRGDVRGGGKKPWQQKGTGRARHGSTRSPIWVGGGVAHGPRNDKNYDRKINKKMKAKAIYTILSQKMRDGELMFVDSLSLSAPKTKEAKSALNSLGKASGFEMLAERRNNAALIAIPSIEKNVKLGFQNMGNLEVMETRNINPLALLQYKYVVMVSPKESIETLNSKMN